MTRTYLSLATVVVLALAGCANKNTANSSNPDSTGGDAGADSGTDGTDDTAGTPSRARGATSTRGSGRKTAARTITTKKPARKPADPVPEGEPTINGMVVQGYALDSAEALPDFTGLTASGSPFEIPNLDVDDTDVAEGFPGFSALQANYALQFKGSINITEEAEYELCLHSDDGSQLLLEDQLVVDNDGVHDGAVEACELVYLPAGEYRLEVRYFQADGPSLTLHFAWAVNGGDKVIVPTEVLFKP